MSHAFPRLWVHAVLVTKFRRSLISSECEQALYDFIRVQLEGMGCKVRIIHGVSDHIHCLFLLHYTKSIAEVMKRVKGSSSRYMNSDVRMEGKFKWQTGYGAFSVSHHNLDQVHRYIQNQKIRHGEGKG